MEIIRPGLNIDFIGKRKIFLMVSMVAILVGMISLMMHGGPRYGIDFTGGTMVQVAFGVEVDTSQIREALADKVEGKPIVQAFVGKDREFIIQLKQTSADLGGVEELVKSTLGAAFGSENVSVSQAKMVGPKVGRDLRQKGVLAILFALGAILLYIWWRFELHFGIGAIVALAHDVIITIGVFSLFDKQFDLTIIAALLTIVGYSLNDTIVVYDRARENMKRMGSKADFAKVLNTSVNETLSRTLLTSGTTLAVVLALFTLGGGVIHDFAFALLVGVIVGTYSSIYVASPMVLWLRTRERAKKMATA
jgi:preprotein translocase subunit SecF